MSSSVKSGGGTRTAITTLEGLAAALQCATSGAEPVDGVDAGTSNRYLPGDDAPDPTHAPEPQFTLSLLTTGTDGWPVTSLLGPGEAFVIDAARVRIALWSSARANANLAREERATLDFIFDGCFYQLRLRAIGRAPLELAADVPSGGAGHTLVCHELVLVEGEAQRVPYAELTSGIRYRLTGDAAARRETAERWRMQQAALAAFAGICA